jgi:hypothetical protein
VVEEDEAPDFGREGEQAGEDTGLLGLGLRCCLGGTGGGEAGDGAGRRRGAEVLLEGEEVLAEELLLQHPDRVLAHVEQDLDVECDLRCHLCC